MTVQEFIPYLGVFVVIFGVGIWLIKKPGDQRNYLKIFGLEVNVANESFVIISFGVALLLLSQNDNQKKMDEPKREGPNTLIPPRSDLNVGRDVSPPSVSTGSNGTPVPTKNNSIESSSGLKQELALSNVSALDATKNQSIKKIVAPKSFRKQYSGLCSDTVLFGFIDGIWDLDYLSSKKNEHTEKDILRLYLSRNIDIDTFKVMISRILDGKDTSNFIFTEKYKIYSIVDQVSFGKWDFSLPNNYVFDCDERGNLQNGYYVDLKFKYRYTELSDYMLFYTDSSMRGAIGLGVYSLQSSVKYK